MAKNDREQSEREHHDPHPDVNSSREAFLFVLAAIIVSACIQFQSMAFTDPDGFYHFGHAQVYATHGPLYQEFPWAALSVIGEKGADIWWGFHVLLIPFTFIPDPVIALKIAATFILSAFLILFYWGFRRMSLPLPWLWPFFVLLISPFELWRWMAVRPGTLSAPLILLLLTFLVSPRRWWAPAVCGFAISFVHQTFSWTTVGIVAAFVVVCGLVERRFAWRESVVALSGVGLGWILRPAATDALELMRIQIVELGRLKAEGVPLAFGTEVYPLTYGEITQHFVPLLAMWVAILLAAVYYLGSRRLRLAPKDYTLLFTAAVLSIGFFALSILSSARGTAPWIVFAVSVVAIGVGKLFLERDQVADSIRQKLETVSIVALVALGAWSVSGTSAEFKRQAIVADKLKPAMEWARENTPKDSLMMHLNWSIFPQLFLWNKHNRFMGGMDPVFQYFYNPDYYWAVQQLESRSSINVTYKSPPSDKTKPVDTYDFLKRDLGADYLLILESATPELAEFARADNRFQERFSSGGVVIFQLM